MSQTEPSLVNTVTCPNCAANIEITPDALAFVCEYCGWAGTTEAVEQKGYLMVRPLPRNRMYSVAVDFLRRNLKRHFQQAAMEAPHPTAIPFWVVQVHANTKYDGYRKETRSETYTTTHSDGKGGTHTVTHTKTYPVYIPVRGTSDDYFTYTILARKHALFFGLDEVRRLAESSSTEPLDTKLLLSDKYEFLDVELEEREVGSMAETWATAAHRKEAESKTSKLFDCYTQTNVEWSKLILYPVYTLSYEYAGEKYRATIDGASGKPLKSEFPMTKGLRISYTVSGYTIILGAAIAAFFLANSKYAPFAMPVAASAILSALPLYRATASQRVRSWS